MMMMMMMMMTFWRRREEQEKKENFHHRKIFEAMNRTTLLLHYSCFNGGNKRSLYSEDPRIVLTFSHQNSFREQVNFPYGIMNIDGSFEDQMLVVETRLQFAEAQEQKITLFFYCQFKLQSRKNILRQSIDESHWIFDQYSQIDLDV